MLTNVHTGWHFFLFIEFGEKRNHLIEQRKWEEGDLQRKIYNQNIKFCEASSWSLVLVTSNIIRHDEVSEEKKTLICAYSSSRSKTLVVVRGVLQFLRQHLQYILFAVSLFFWNRKPLNIRTLPRFMPSITYVMLQAWSFLQ